MVKRREAAWIGLDQKFHFGPVLKIIDKTREKAGIKNELNLFPLIAYRYRLTA